MTRFPTLSSKTQAVQPSSSGPEDPGRRSLLKLGLVTTLLHSMGAGFPQGLLAAESPASTRLTAGSDWSAVSPFLAGNFAPVAEERDDLRLEVIGTLPPELRGTFLRNGPNPHYKPMKRYHWFDGDGMVHAVHVQDGVASYRNRFVHTRGYELEEKADQALYPSITEPPFKSKAPRGEARMKNAANTALLNHGGKLLALWEGGNPYEVRLPDLSTVGEYTFQGSLHHAFTAHPKVDPVTGELMTFGYRIERKPYVSYSVFNPDHTLRHTVPIDVPKPLMMHDFAITEHHSIFMDLPEVFDLWRVLRGHSPLVFEPRFGARLGVLPRHGKASELKWFEIEPCYVFHVLNAWEEGDEVVLTACRYPHFPEFLDGESAATSKSNTFAYLHEWRLNLVTGKVTERPLDDRPSEFPQLNPQVTGRKARYGYWLGKGGTDLVKFDLQTGKRLMRPMPGRSSEPQFVARPNAKAEDDGWVVSLAYNEATQKGELVVLDAGSFDSEPVARVLLPVRVPFGFHALWVPEAHSVAAL